MQQDPQDFAVLLNDNARRVSSRVRDNVLALVPRSSLFYTHTTAEAEDALVEIVRRRVSTLFCGGGDGTLVHVVSQLKRILESLNRGAVQGYLAPKLGLLKLGTGNGWANYMGARAGVEPIRSFASTAWRSLSRFNLIEGENRTFHFSGLGWDAAILNDYILFKERFGVGPAKRFMLGLGGYLTSMFLKTVPEQLARRNRPRVRIVAEGPVYEVSATTPPRLVEPPSGLVYEGPCNITGVSTVPEYGFGLSAFPFARARDGFMNLRVIKAGVLELLAHMHDIWVGKWEGRNLADYLVKKVSIAFDRPMPFQVGGDALGLRENVSFSVSDFEVDVVTT
jgi:diacylglycerol kinase family enzyme